jgi:hypothetical protein
MIAINSSTVDQQENPVTSHLYIKPKHPAQTLDKEVVLRRFRQRKRLNKVKATLKALLGSPFSEKPEQVSVPVPEKKWVDDAFAAP